MKEDGAVIIPGFCLDRCEMLKSAYVLMFTINATYGNTPMNGRPAFSFFCPQADKVYAAARSLAASCTGHGQISSFLNLWPYAMRQTMQHSCIV